MKQVCEILDENPKRIQYWILQRLFEPFDPSSGTGTKRLFSFENLMDITLASLLSNATFNIKVIRYLIGQAHRDAPEVFAGDAADTQSVLAVQMIGKNAQVTRVFDPAKEPSGTDDMLSEGVPVMLIDLNSVKSKLLKKLKFFR